MGNNRRRFLDRQQRNDRGSHRLSTGKPPDLVTLGKNYTLQTSSFYFGNQVPERNPDSKSRFSQKNYSVIENSFFIYHITLNTILTLVIKINLLQTII